MRQRRTRVFEFFPGNNSWSFTSSRLIAESYYGGGEFNECVRAFSRVRAGDGESWHKEWMATADAAQAIAEGARSAGRGETAKGAYFRASNYYRNAEFFLSHTDPRKIETYKKSLASFRGAAELDDGIEVIEVPFENAPMPGYFFHPTPRREKPPVVIFMGGADSTAEELYFLATREALIRGNACVIVDGPGRGGMLRLNKVPARPDYEKPISKRNGVVKPDSSEKDVAPQKIASTFRL